jgi:hypothetical protein
MPLAPLEASFSFKASARASGSLVAAALPPAVDPLTLAAADWAVYGLPKTPSENSL